jgi:riboflavin biosynthesis pyrimidine reductase
VIPPMSRLLPGASEPIDVGNLYNDPPIGIRANMVISLDGAAAFNGRVRPISDATDLQLLLAIRSYADVVLIGAGTVRAERYGPVRLDAAAQDRRLAAGQSAIPPVAVVTLRGNLDLSSALFTSGQPPIVVTTAHTATVNPELARASDLIIAGEHRVDLVEAKRQLAHRGMHRVLCEGGPVLLDNLIHEDLVDELCLTVSPRFAGYQPVSGVPSQLAVPRQLELRHVLHHDGFLYLRYTR